MLSPALPFQRNKIESIPQAWIPRFEYGDYHLMDMDCFHQWVSIWVFRILLIVNNRFADPSLNITSYVGHTDAIWDFKLFPIARNNTCLLASASADGTVKLWDTQTSGQLLKSTLTYNGVNTEGQRGKMENEQVMWIIWLNTYHVCFVDSSLPAPTSLDFCHTDLNKMIVSYTNADIRVFDVETGQVTETLQGSNENYGKPTLLNPS